MNFLIIALHAIHAIPVKNFALFYSLLEGLGCFKSPELWWHIDRLCSPLTILHLAPCPTLQQRQIVTVMTI
jgi:hypothetical protein